AGGHMVEVMKTDRARPRAGVGNEQGDRAGLQSHPPRFVAALRETVRGKIPGARFAYRERVRVYCHAPLSPFAGGGPCRPLTPPGRAGYEAAPYAAHNEFFFPPSGNPRPSKLHFMLDVSQGQPAHGK